jgi:predicted enzyme related to lactoylglutathione lyase
MIKSIAFFVYVVKNIKAARRFYEEILELKLTHEFKNEWFEYDLDGATFVVAKEDKTHRAPISGAMLAFEVEDLVKTVEALKQKNVKVSLECLETPVCHIALILDPSGNEIMLHQKKVAAVKKTPVKKTTSAKKKGKS